MLLQAPTYWHWQQVAAATTVAVMAATARAAAAAAATIAAAATAAMMSAVIAAAAAAGSRHQQATAAAEARTIHVARCPSLYRVANTYHVRQESNAQVLAPAQKWSFSRAAREAAESRLRRP